MLRDPETGQLIKGAPQEGQFVPLEVKGRTTDLVGKELGVSRKTIERDITLATKLPREVQKGIDNSEIQITSALEIAKLDNDPKLQTTIAKSVVGKGWSVATVKKNVKQHFIINP